MNHLFHLPSTIAHWLDGLSIAALIGSLIGVLPNLSMLLTMTWMAIRIYETDTVQKWLRGRKEAADE